MGAGSKAAVWATRTSPRRARAAPDQDGAHDLPPPTYDFGQSARISLGALLSTGDEPSAGPGGLPLLASEFGAYGTMGFTTVAVYF